MRAYRKFTVDKAYKYNRHDSVLLYFTIWHAFDVKSLVNWKNIQNAHKTNWSEMNNVKKKTYI